MLTERYTEWINYMAKRDYDLMQQALLAVALVVAYVSIQVYPSGWQEPARRLYLAFGMPLYVLMVILNTQNIALTAAQVVQIELAIVPLVVAFIVGDWYVTRHRAR